MNLCDRNEIQALLSRHGFKFAKSLGQNFLIDPQVPYDIAAASQADATCGVLEIGPGIGCLTDQLCKRAGKVVSVELDQRLYPVLGETMASYPHFILLEADAMKLDFAQVVQTHFDGLTPILCANLPYNITTPVLTKIVTSGVFESLTVLIQKEVAQRICAQPGTPDYGAFTLLIQYYTQPELLFFVPPTAFLPAPKVTSAVLHCRTRKTPAVQVSDETAFWRTVRAGFALRRKTLVNSLQTGWTLPKETLTDAVTTCGFSPDVRGERLSLADYAALTEELLNRS